MSEISNIGSMKNDPKACPRVSNAMMLPENADEGGMQSCLLDLEQDTEIKHRNEDRVWRLLSSKWITKTCLVMNQIG